MPIATRSRKSTAVPIDTAHDVQESASASASDRSDSPPPANVTQRKRKVAAPARAKDIKIGALPKKHPELVKWLIDNINDFLAAPEKTQSNILSKIFASYGRHEFTPDVIRVLELLAPTHLEQLKKSVADCVHNSYDKFTRQSIPLSAETLQTLIDLGYITIADLGSSFVLSAFKDGSLAAVNCAIWAFKAGASLPAIGKRGYCSMTGFSGTVEIKMVDLEAMETADAFLTTQGIPFVFKWDTYGHLGIDQAKQIVEWAQERKIDLPGLWKTNYLAPAAWVKWLDSRGLLPPADKRVLDKYDACCFSKAQLAALKAVGFTVLEDKPTEPSKETATFEDDMKALCGIRRNRAVDEPPQTHVYRSNSAERAARLTGPMPDRDSPRFVEWIRNNLPVVLKNAALQSALSEEVFRANRKDNIVIADDVLDALGAEGAKLLKTGLFESDVFKYSRLYIHKIPSATLQRLHGLGVFTIDELPASIVADGFNIGRLEAVQTAIWAFKAGKALAKGTVNVRIIEPAAAAMAIEFLNSQNLQISAMIRELPKTVDAAKDLITWIREQTWGDQILKKANDWDTFTHCSRFGAEWPQWLDEQGVLPARDKRVLSKFMVADLREDAPEYLAALVAVGFTEEVEKPRATVQYRDPAAAAADETKTTDMTDEQVAAVAAAAAARTAELETAKLERRARLVTKLIDVFASEGLTITEPACQKLLKLIKL